MSVGGQETLTETKKHHLKFTEGHKTDVIMNSKNVNTFENGQKLRNLPTLQTPN